MQKNHMTPFIPNPMDTSDVVLPQELLELGETIARHVHDVWSQNRIHEGWTYGPELKDALLQTTCLVPYEQLSEEEKAYDRNTAFSTLKLICKLGYKIVKNEA